MYSKFRPLRATRWTFTEGPRMAFAPLPLNSRPRASPNWRTTEASQVAPMARSEGQTVQVPPISGKLVRKPPAASCMFKLGMSKRGIATVFPIYHHFRKSHQPPPGGCSQPNPRSNEYFSPCGTIRSVTSRPESSSESSSHRICQVCVPIGGPSVLPAVVCASFEHSPSSSKSECRLLFGAVTERIQREAVSFLPSQLGSR
mmetsp:Transcript_108463/g.272833  ORF Transcript_108463/g.272833 Transcript_108463/m.272833 type:complete len:201 (+) Transcript_108463:2049-2651(+)